MFNCTNNLINQTNIFWIENEIVSESEIVLKESESKSEEK